jgi:hypothetical protein
MSRFKAEIPIDPAGYEWVNEDAMVLGEDEDSDYERSMVLYGRSREKVYEEFRKGDGASLPGETYDPFSVEPSLFRILAALDPTPESILSFVHQYGDASDIDYVLERDEFTLADWKSLISDIGQSVALADDFVESREQRRTSTKKARAALDFVNETLGWANLHAAADVGADGAINLHVVVHDLLSVLKLQIVEAILDQKKYRNCDQCGKPFELSPSLNRSDRVFCSDNCRVKAYYRRKIRAVELRNSGASIREIMKETGSDADTINKWLSLQKKKFEEVAKVVKKPVRQAEKINTKLRKKRKGK